MVIAVAHPFTSRLLQIFDSPRPEAGFPSPAADFVEGQLDLNQFLISRPSSTFFVLVAGDSLDRAGIKNGDHAVVDRSLKPLPDDILVVVLYGELLIKRMRREFGQVWLDPDSTDASYKPYLVPPDAQLEVWGVVTGIFRKYRQ